MNKKGFTLIELLIVVAIISILAGIVLVGLRPSIGTARDVRRASELKQLQTALAVYYARYGAYPQDFAEMTAAIGAAKPDPLGDPGLYDYQYAPVGGNPASDYIIGVRLELPVGDTLKAGAVKTGNSGGGLDCAQPDVYCLSGY